MTKVGGIFSVAFETVCVYCFISITYNNNQFGTDIAIYGVPTKSGKNNPAEEIS
jgi:hypothetical protein